MEAYELITTRRMCGRVLEEPPARQEIERLIEAAVCAPNHHLTQPWRFIVLSGKALDDLGDAMAERVRTMEAGSPDLSEKVEKERARPKRAPVIIAVIYVPSAHPRAIEVEDRYAVGAAVQNMLLAAHGMGLGAFWRTGAAAADSAVRRLLYLAEQEEIAAFVYVGYPLKDSASAPKRLASAPGLTTWLPDAD